MSKSIIKEKSFSFAIEIVGVYKELKRKNEFVLSRQILKSGTSIGANISEAVHAQSRRDFAAKLHISRKEANETLYWIELLEATNYLDSIKSKKLKNDCIEIQKILSSILLTVKNGK